MNQQASVMLSQPSDSEVLTAMHRFGGSFASSLAQAWFHADATNSARLRAAFPELWGEYRKLAALEQVRGVLFDRIADALYRGNHNRSDLQTDYFDVGWFVDVNIGTYERPFVNTAAGVAVGLQEEILKTAAWLDQVNAGVPPSVAERNMNAAVLA